MSPFGFDHEFSFHATPVDFSISSQCVDLPTCLFCFLFLDPHSHKMAGLGISTSWCLLDEQRRLVLWCFALGNFLPWEKPLPWHRDAEGPCIFGR